MRRQGRLSWRLRSEDADARPLRLEARGCHPAGMGGGAAQRDDIAQPATRQGGGGIALTVDGDRSSRSWLAWRSCLACLVVFSLSCLVFWLDSRAIRMPPAWRTFEFCQYAEIGRNLAQEGKYDTRLVEPMALAMLDRSGAGSVSARWPVVDRYPLPCLAVAGLMKAFGPTATVAAWSNGLAISLLAAACYAAARRWYGPGWASAVAVLFLANPSFYGEFVLLGTPDVWFAAIFVGELLLWSRSGGDRPQLGWAAGLGLLGGLAYLARFNASLFLGLMVASLLARRRWREAAVFVATAAVVSSPIFVYNWVRVGKPVDSLYSAWNLLDGIGAYRVEPWLYYRVPDLVGELASHASGAVGKFTGNLLVVARGLWSLWRLEPLWPLALVAPWLAARGTPHRRFAGWALGLFGLQLVIFSAMRLEFEGRASPFTGRYFFWFGGPAVLLGVGTLARLSARWPAVRRLGMAVVVVQLGLFGWAWVGHPALAFGVGHQHRRGPGPAHAGRSGRGRSGDRLESAADHRVVRRPPVDLDAGRPGRARPPEPRLSHAGRLSLHRHEL